VVNTLFPSGKPQGVDEARQDFGGIFQKEDDVLEGFYNEKRYFYLFFHLCVSYNVQ
jgi:hypothetical protein